MVTKHAAENSKKYLNPQHTNKAAALRFTAQVNLAMGKRHSTAVILTLDNPVSNPHRDDWALNDRLVGVVRNRNLVTVMLSRAAQINKKHLRTDSITYV